MVSDEYVIWRNDDAVLIEAGGERIMLTKGAANRLGEDLRPAVPRHSPARRITWTADRIAELTRLYVDERVGSTEIGRLWGVTPGAITQKIILLNLPRHNPSISASIRAAHARRRAA